MKYTKNSNVTGGWVKASEVESGSVCKLVSEAAPMEGEYGTQDVAKIRFKGETGESKNVRLNKPTVNALIDAFGDDSKQWIGKLLTAHTEKMLVGGKRVIALYLIPEGFEMTEDEGGYLVISKQGEVAKKAELVDEAPEEIEEEGTEAKIDPDDIPF